MKTLILEPAPCPPAAPPEPLRLPLSCRVPLVKVDTVVAARGQHAETVIAQANRGVLRWVFDICAISDGAARELRFWNREVSLFAAHRCAEHAALRAAPLPSVLREILGDHEQFRSGEVCLLLGIRRPTLTALRDRCLPVGREIFLRRDLERFLTRRLWR
jgi:hypothetical protein